MLEEDIVKEWKYCFDDYYNTLFPIAESLENKGVLQKQKLFRQNSMELLENYYNRSNDHFDTLALDSDPEDDLIFDMEVDKKQVIANTNHLLCFENLSQGSQTDNNVESSPNNYVNSNNLSENSEKIHKRKLDQNDIKIEKETNINNKEEESDDKSTSETEDEEYVKPSKRRKLKKKSRKSRKEEKG